MQERAASSGATRLKRGTVDADPPVESRATPAIAGSSVEGTAAHHIGRDIYPCASYVTVIVRLRRSSNLLSAEPPIISFAANSLEA